MITITYMPCRLVLKGHAGAGDYGHDLVCCAVSALAYTLVCALEEIRAPGLVWNLQPGLGQVSCKPGKGAREAFRVVLAGLRLLAKEYPGSLQFAEISPEVRE